MKPDSVIVDLAGEAAVTASCQSRGTLDPITVRSCPLNVPSTLAEHASQLYARNIRRRWAR